MWCSHSGNKPFATSETLPPLVQGLVWQLHELRVTEYPRWTWFQSSLPHQQLLPATAACCPCYCCLLSLLLLLLLPVVPDVLAAAAAAACLFLLKFTRQM